MIRTLPIRLRQRSRNPRGVSWAALGKVLLHRSILWRRLLVAVCLLTGLLAWAPAQARGTQAVPVSQAINRGLSFLARDAVAWKEEHNCSSCHHAALVVWSMNEAKRHGYTVDEPVRADMTRWLTEAGEGKFNYTRPAAAPQALNPKAIYYSLGLNSVPEQNPAQREALNRLLETVKADQTGNGSWSAWPDTRPPILTHSDESMTALACLALLPTAIAGDSTAQAALNHGVEWLKGIKSDNDPQSVALRLALWTRLGQPQSERTPLIRLLKKRQNRDGGWSQTPDGPSDAWATGQALYALCLGDRAGAESAIRSGRAFLVKTQREDGSWPMTSRPTKPGGAGSDSLIPIIGGGSAWAVIGLARSENVATDGGASPRPSSPGKAFTGTKAGAEISVGGLRLCWCPPGKFLMGSPPGEPERRPDEDQVEVILTKGFWTSKFEATQGDWKRALGRLPGPFTAELPEGDDLPVGNVNFAEAEAYCQKLTELGHRSGELPPGWEFRLPTEAQWEYACRAGTTTATAFGDRLSSRQANFKGKPYNGADPGPSPGRAVKVGSYPPNAWGLHDMHGNTFEWCRDWYHAKLPGGIDPDLHSAQTTANLNRTGDTSRCRRGGAWVDDGWPCRSAFRLRFEPERRYDHIGFRVVVVNVSAPK